MIAGLINNRYEIENVKSYIFSSIEDVTDVVSIQAQADAWVHNHMFMNMDYHLNLYVTGLSIALVAVINACLKNKYSITLYHYNRETREYFPQDVDIDVWG